MASFDTSSHIGGGYVVFEDFGGMCLYIKKNSVADQLVAK